MQVQMTSQHFYFFNIFMQKYTWSPFMRFIALTLAVCFWCEISGCAAIINGSSQTINFNSDPPGATIYAGANKGVTPASMELKRDENYFVKMKKEGYQEAQVPINKELSGWFWFGLILWGVFEMISLGTGGAYKLSPNQVLLTLEPEKIVAPQPIYQQPPVQPYYQQPMVQPPLNQQPNYQNQQQINQQPSNQPQQQPIQQQEKQ